MTPTRCAVCVLPFLLALSLPAHALRLGVGYGVGVHRVSVDKDDTVNGIDLVRMSGHAAMTYSPMVNKLSLFDTSGVLLAALGTAGGQEMARRAAVERAIERGESTATYTYEQLAPAPGRLTRFDILWGSATGATHYIAPGAIDDDGIAVPEVNRLPDAPVSMYGFDLIVGLGEFELWSVPIGFSLQATGMTYEIEHVSTQGSNSVIDHHDWNRGGLFLNFTPYYELLPDLVVSARLSIDPLFTPVRMLLFGFGGHWLAASVVLNATYQPFSFLMVQADLELARDGMVDTGGTVLAASVNAALFFGSSD